MQATEPSFPIPPTSTGGDTHRWTDGLRSPGLVRGRWSTDAAGDTLQGLTRTRLSQIPKGRGAEAARGGAQRRRRLRGGKDPRAPSTRKPAAAKPTRHPRDPRSAASRGPPAHTDADTAGSPGGGGRGRSQSPRGLTLERLLRRKPKLRSPAPRGSTRLLPPRSLTARRSPAYLRIRPPPPSSA